VIRIFGLRCFSLSFRSFSTKKTIHQNDFPPEYWQNTFNRQFVSLIRYWKSLGVEVLVSTADVSTESGCEELMSTATTLGAVGGIFNFAMVLNDGVLINKTVENFEQSFAPKAIATKHLHEISLKRCPKLEHFVVYSSIACGVGSPGQTTYGMANSVMERIIEKRHSMGLPAKALQLGKHLIGLSNNIQQKALLSLRSNRRCWRDCRH
jgi:hypothetical protein